MSATSVERQIFGVLDPLDGFAGVRDKFQIGNALPDGAVELVCVNNSAEALASLLSPFRFAQQVVILCEEDAPQLSRAVE